MRTSDVGFDKAGIMSYQSVSSFTDSDGSKIKLLTRKHKKKEDKTKQKKEQRKYVKKEQKKKKICIGEYEENISENE